MNFACPSLANPAILKAELGFPDSGIFFTQPGEYQCEAELGIITKSSCAGAHYRELAKRLFKITVVDEKR